ncbi:MAG TPA: aminotransferase class I/II-fold pyridoxal phosphate-dependent enzyme [Chitinophagaceae bacterium]|nr:aminotransferase class I/II-fold pyridoxal phosphate-dependent enzyme [Chitinophagaceae bacterium]
MSNYNRRDFFKATGLAALPALLPAQTLFAGNKNEFQPPPAEPVVKLFGDGEMFDGTGYLEQLQAASAKQLIKADRYGIGGAVEELEKKFAVITGKEKAIYMPTGTLANQLAIAVLSGENTKVFVQDTSHVYRDEADAAQSVFNKRLMPLVKNETYFSAAALKQAIAALDHEEVFKSGIGCVSIENPVRRKDGRMFPLEEIKLISEYCKANKIGLHLDGARLYMASAWSGTSVKEYSSYFDTVYISLYKYLGASGGAVLCGDKAIIDKMPHLIKIHGGNQFGNWLNAAMALHRLEGMEERLQQSIARFKEIMNALNQLPGLNITAYEGGTNIYSMQLPPAIIPRKFADTLQDKYFIRMPVPDDKGNCKISVNETLLYRDPNFVIHAFKDSIKTALT